jgi:hypothetical protein
MNKKPVRMSVVSVDEMTNENDLSVRLLWLSSPWKSYGQIVRGLHHSKVAESS